MSKVFTILLVEDSEPLRELYKEEFKQNNFNVVEAEDGEIGTNFAIEYRPDIILLDLMLPKRGGLGVVRILRSLPETKEIPIIILTALPNPEYQLDAGTKVQGYFLKTQIRPGDLVKKVRQLLESD